MELASLFVKDYASYYRVPMKKDAPTTETKRHVPTDEELKEAAQLKAAWNHFRTVEKVKGRSVTQDAIGDELGWSQGNLSHYLNGRMALNIKALLAICARIGAEPAKISPRLTGAYPADQIRNLTRSDTNRVGPKGHQRDVSADLKVIEIPIFSARGSMGLGEPLPENDAVIDYLRLTKNWVDQNIRSLSNPANLAVLSAKGDSMLPTFSEGDILLVDCGVERTDVDAVYVIERHNELFVKRVQRQYADGSIVIRSDNPNYGPEVVPADKVADVRVLGRVLWAWNGRKL